MIFFSSQKLIDNILNEIENAQKSIDIEVYIWDPDKVGKMFEDALIRAADRGVKVRVMVDRIGSLEWIATRMDELKNKGIEARVFRPITGIRTFIKYYASISNFVEPFNRRNHRKVFVIDKRIAYVGSLNVFANALEWKEATLKTESYSEIKILMEIFECTWDWIEDDRARFRKCDFRQIIHDVEKSKMIRTTQTPSLRKHYRQDFLNRIHSAKERIWLVTPYFNPPRFLLKALINAAHRGVDVRLMIPYKTDHIWFGYLSKAYYAPLIRKGLRIFEYKKGMLHAKTAIIDDIGIVGSGNLNYRSFYRDLELNIVVTKQDEVEALEKEFTRDMVVSKEISKPQDMTMLERAFGSFLTKFKTSF